jgi:hypothetical protein
MAQTSPELHKLFTTEHGLLRESIDLPEEDPVAFYLICQSAHGSFIPQAQISLQTLVNMADAIRRYKIPAASHVHNTVVYSFIVQTLRPETLSTADLLKLLGVAKALGSSKYEQLSRDVFLLRPLRLEALPTKQNAGGCNAESVLLLGMNSTSTNATRFAKSNSKSDATGGRVPCRSGNHAVELAE